MLALVMCFFPPDTVHAWLDGLSETLRELNPKRRTEIELSCSE
jgi:hypothetical protein